jgi:hypothetical protein
MTGLLNQTESNRISGTVIPAEINVRSPPNEKTKPTRNLSDSAIADSVSGVM